MAFSLMNGPPGTARITKKVTVMTTHTVRIARAIRLRMYIRVLVFMEPYLSHGFVSTVSPEMAAAVVHIVMSHNPKKLVLIYRFWCKITQI